MRARVLCLGNQGLLISWPIFLPSSPCRLDLITQINEIEARKEEYPETIAFIRLLNSLVASAGGRSSSGGGGGGAALGGTGAAGAEGGGGGGGQELSHFTAFVVNHVLAHLRQRAYK